MSAGYYSFNKSRSMIMRVITHGRFVRFSLLDIHIMFTHFRYGFAGMNLRLLFGIKADLVQSKIAQELNQVVCGHELVLINVYF